MNAPEKIYLVNENLDTTREWYITKQVGFDSIEYTRTDALIENACKWLEKNFNMPNDFKYHFQKAMKGE